MKESLTALLHLKKVVLLPFFFQLTILSLYLMRNQRTVSNCACSKSRTKFLALLGWSLEEPAKLKLYREEFCDLLKMPTMRAGCRKP